MKYAIINGKIVTPDKVLEDKALIIDGDRIEAISDCCDGCETYDAKGGYVLPGFVEMHIHGGDGYDFMDGTEEAFDKILSVHLKHGITALAPTTIACSLENMKELFDTYKEVCNKTDKSRLLGIHLEGPFITKVMKGAQPERYIINPTEEVLDKIFSWGDGIISRISGAPEIEGMDLLAKRAREKNITLAVGHSDAIAPQVLKAYDMGFTHITHMYCSTPSVHKIEQTVYAGIIEAAYLTDGITVELIGDGKHIPKEAMQLAVKIKGAEKVALITDAMRAAGTDATESYLGAKEPKNRVIIEDGVAKLPDRTSYAGSIATADNMLKNAVVNYELPLCTVSKMMSLAPAKILGVDKNIGSIEPGKYADLVIMDKDFSVTDVFVGGDKKNIQ